MDKFKKTLMSIYSHAVAPESSSNEYQHILAKLRKSVPTKIDKIRFTLAVASLLLAVIFISPNQTQIETQTQQIYIYNFSKAYNPN